jgi:hypothetical protein
VSLYDRSHKTDCEAAASRTAASRLFVAGRADRITPVAVGTVAGG